MTLITSPSGNADRRSIIALNLAVEENRLLIGVTGGIAAYKAIETARLAIRAGHAVRVMQTPNSARFAFLRLSTDGRRVRARSLAWSIFFQKPTK